ncbi:MAG: TonB-dependent receptor, partial [Burkholderiaceae bacterium]
TQQQLEGRTVYRPGEMLEAIPGLIVSQHSGEGKANQFYLRGFNLDHGTDLRTTVDGMLVNARTHSHGQGWTDLNFLIPELATGLRYKKGPYDASEGDFASAGAVEVIYADTLERGIASIGFGQNGFRRVLLADSPALAGGHLVYAIEGMHNDGPFVNPDDYRRFNGVLRYSRGDRANGWNVTGMAYDASWNATDQIPKRAVDDGSLDRFASIDPSDGGKARRNSLSGEWRRADDTSSTRVNAYVISSKLDLISNFTYFLDDEVDGDQFAQPDRRVTTALNASHTIATPMFGKAVETTFGAQVQNDTIHNGLLRTLQRQEIGVTRRDHVVETSVGIYAQAMVPWTPIFRTVTGVRADRYRFKVDSDNALNSGRADDTIVSPKLSLILGPFDKTEFYVNAGTGFHSNDARGTTITVDPSSGDPVDKVSPLVRSKGYEVGARTSFIPGLQTSLSVHRLDLDSELLFVGDAGGTQATRPSRRVGFELANYYKLNDWLTVDADVAYARARFKDEAPEGSRIPGAVEGVASFALAFDHLGPWFGALQYRWFGPRPLLEDDSVRSNSTATFNGRVGYKLTRDLSIELEGFNLTNRKASAIDYYYESRLASEPSGVATSDIHFHPIESRSFRVTAVLRY